MPEFLYIFGYEGPSEIVVNSETRSDFESSDGIWIVAESAEEALKTGQAYATNFVNQLFADEGVENAGWSPEDYANWIEREPLQRFSGLALEALPRIDLRNDQGLESSE